jgi:hypothetical protein
MNRVVVFLVVVAVIVVAAHIAFQFVTEQNRAAMVARVRKPESLVFYERLAEEENNDQEATTSEVFEREGQSPTQDTQDPVETMARYERLFARTKEQSFRETWERLLDDILSRHPSEWTAEERSQVEVFMSANQDLVREIKELAERGGPVYPLDFSQGFQIPVPHLEQLRDCTRLLRADAIAKALNGQYYETVEDVIAGMKLADALAQEPILISHFVRVAMYGTMTETVQESVTGGRLPPELISELLTHADNADNRQAFAESFTGEQLLGLQSFSNVRDGNYSLDEVLSDVYGNNPSPLERAAGSIFFRFYASPFGRPWLNMDESAYAAVFGRVADAAELPYYEAQPLLSQIEQDVENLPFTRVGTRVPLPTIRACQAQARHEAALDLMQMGLVLEQYHAQRGLYPETLDAIAPSLGGSLPADPFTGEPYQYRPSDDGFLLYSVGSNLADNGGRHEYGQGDIVWRGQRE